jgi:hypothetical protein
MQAPHCMQPPSSNTKAEDEQFARFLDAANRLGEDDLDVIFSASFEKLVSQAPPQSQALREDGRLTPVPPELEVLCTRLEKGESCPVAAKVIRQQAHEIANLLARLNRAYARVPDEAPSEIMQEAAPA